MKKTNISVMNTHGFEVGCEVRIVSMKPLYKKLWERIKYTFVRKPPEMTFTVVEKTDTSLSIYPKGHSGYWEDR